ncbi:unnamed protein product [Calypogeia fissa]
MIMTLSPNQNTPGGWRDSWQLRYIWKYMPFMQSKAPMTNDQHHFLWWEEAFEQAPMSSSLLWSECVTIQHNFPMKG